MKIDNSKLTKDMIREHIDELYTELHDVKQLKWLPKKQKRLKNDCLFKNHDKESGLKDNVLSKSNKDVFARW